MRLLVHVHGRAHVLLEECISPQEYSVAIAPSAPPGKLFITER
ncbi:hypothetical protein GGP46_003003 [Salinibacter ruber]|nr:hypothetical protein [Salinibacter ruber]